MVTEPTPAPVQTGSPTKPVQYSLAEHFGAFQGEGDHMGRAAYFLRLHGCDQRCPWCDSAGTWHANWMPGNVPKLSADELADLVPTNHNRPAFVVLTGGEPTLYNLVPLVDALHSRGHMVHLETAGHHSIPNTIDWVTLSPKPFAKPPLWANVLKADEFKIIVENIKSVWDGLDAIGIGGARRGALQNGRTHHGRPVSIWLQPEWGQRDNPDVLRVINEAVQANVKLNLRAGYQLHKLYRCDAMDANSSKSAVPLGGDPARGASQ